jgi:subtilisin family serine protease
VRVYQFRHIRGPSDSSFVTSHSSVTRIAACLVLVLAVLALGGTARTPESATAPPTAHVVVTLQTPAPGSLARIRAEQAAFRRQLARALPDARIRWRYELVANGVSVVLPARDLQHLRRLAGVRSVHAASGYRPQLDATPQQIGATALWGAGLSTAGQGVKVGIIDTGVDHTHPFFDPSGFTMPAGFPKGQVRYTNAKVIVARAFAPPTSRNAGARQAFDGGESSHGTHVAGIAAGNANVNAAGRTVSGVAPRAYIGNYKALVRTDSGLSPNGNAPEIVAAIEAAVRDGMDVINLSIGEPEIEPSRDVVALALDAAAARGVVPVVAAGNDYNDAGAGSISSPANSARSITVGAIESGGGSRLHADFSSVGPTTMSLRLKPDVAAPGVDVLSSVPRGWGGLSGTSMASPHVAGAAALLLQRHPSWTVAEVKSALIQTGLDAVNERGTRVAPTFQGGGAVSLTAADNPLLFAEPSSVSFGLLAQRGPVKRGTIRLRDAGSGPGVWTAGIDMQNAPAGVSVTLVAPTVSVPGELTWEVRVTANALPRDVTGYVVLQRAGDVRRIPFWGRVTAQRLARHRVRTVPGQGTWSASTKGRPALVDRYRYPEDPRGLGARATLAGPELVYRFAVRRRIANFGVVITSRGPGSRVEPRIVAGTDENRLTGYAGLPVHHNPYLDGFRSGVPAAAALSPRRGQYAIVFDSGTRAGAGRFTFRVWVNDLKPPVLKVRARTVELGRPLLVAATDADSGIYPQSIEASVDGRQVPASYRRGVIRVDTSSLSAGPHRLRLQVSDYQETKNTENVTRILPNTRVLTATFTVRG